MPEQPSPKGQLSLADLRSWLMTGVIFGVPALLAILTDHAGELQLDSEWTALVIMGLGLLGKLIQKLLRG